MSDLKRKLESLIIVTQECPQGETALVCCTRTRRDFLKLVEAHNEFVRMMLSGAIQVQDQKPVKDISTAMPAQPRDRIMVPHPAPGVREEHTAWTWEETCHCLTPIEPLRHDNGWMYCSFCKKPIVETEHDDQ